MFEDHIPYMGYLWVTEEDGIVTIGVDEEAAADLTEDLILNLPDVDDIVMPNKVCGDIESENGNLNIYSPVNGTVLEVNEAILDNPDLIMEDPLDEGWLVKIEADDVERIAKLRDKPTTGEEEPDFDDESTQEITLEDIEEIEELPEE